MIITKSHTLTVTVLKYNLYRVTALKINSSILPKSLKFRKSIHGKPEVSVCT
ncbi:hypothetical protein RND71_004051 [Anisodus tanguticus]|uniref:Uncharacterized protein n=1 Tax=Anisodus tanguticus TaxID=243964 RepID=A0AAE1VXG0_9SOLA|nr:hypothetical protein RND71_004051 [Anisodus tanguticus]